MSKLLFALLLLFSLAAGGQTTIPDSKRAADIRQKMWPRLQKELKTRGLKEDQPVFIRIIKETGILQLWVLSDKEYELFKSYEVCNYSGGLGTKTHDGDNKSPEGYYTITPGQLHPNSEYHLAINIGYPNPLERQLRYTGDAIMIHGDCASIGCYAMTDPIIEEIYTMVYQAFAHGQKSIQLSIVPFKMDDEHMKTYASSPNYPFWKNLKEGYDLFQKTHIPPVVTVNNKTYAFVEGK